MQKCRKLKPPNEQLSERIIPALPNRKPPLIPEAPFFKWRASRFSSELINGQGNAVNEGQESMFDLLQGAHAKDHFCSYMCASFFTSI